MNTPNRSAGLARTRTVLLALVPGIASLLGCTPGQAAPPQGPPRPAATAPAGPTDVAFPPMPMERMVLAGPPMLQEGPSVVNVSGRGEVRVEPDRAMMSFSVETEAATAREAGEANAAQMDRVLVALRSAGSSLPGFRTETSGYSLSPRYAPSREDRPPTIAGYVARNSISVTVDRVTGLGVLIDTALSAGANRVSGISFGVRDPEPHRHEALRLAVESARSEAEVIAEALGLQLGPPLEVHGGADPVFPFAVTADLRTFQLEAQVPTPVEAGEQTVTANVTIRFRLDPRR